MAKLVAHGVRVLAVVEGHGEPAEHEGQPAQHDGGRLARLVARLLELLKRAEEVEREGLGADEDDRDRQVRQRVLPAERRVAPQLALREAHLLPQVRRRARDARIRADEVLLH